MSPEQIGQIAFWDELNKTQPQKINRQLNHLPSAVLGLYKTYKEFSSFYNSFTPDVKKLIETGPAYVISLWAYTRISGRTLEDLKKDQVLLPASLLYNLTTVQDDILDIQRNRGIPTSAKNAFWTTDNIRPGINPRSRYASAIQLIDDNKQLKTSAKTYMKSQLAIAYNKYYAAEDKLGNLAQKPDPDLYSIHLLRAESYGLMARALTAILNGNSCLTFEGLRNEQVMAWFILGGEVLDSEIDIKEDEGLTMSLPQAANVYDQQLGSPDFTTSSKLLAMYLRRVGDEKVSSFLSFSRKCYPGLEQLLNFSKRFARSGFLVGATLNTDKKLLTEINNYQELRVDS